MESHKPFSFIFIVFIVFNFQRFFVSISRLLNGHFRSSKQFFQFTFVLTFEIIFQPRFLVFKREGRNPQGIIQESEERNEYSRSPQRICMSSRKIARFPESNFKRETNCPSSFSENIKGGLSSQGSDESYDYRKEFTKACPPKRAQWSSRFNQNRNGQSSSKAADFRNLEHFLDSFNGEVEEIAAIDIQKVAESLDLNEPDHLESFIKATRKIQEARDELKRLESLRRIKELENSIKYKSNGGSSSSTATNSFGFKANRPPGLFISAHPSK